MALLTKTDIPATGYDLIDRDHDDFIDSVNSLVAADNSDFPALFQHLYEHTVQHFERENSLMEQSRFPAAAEHQAEHQRVLGEFKQFKTRIDKGLLVFGRQFVKERLPEWFKLHVATMDGALAAHLNRLGNAG